MKTRFQVRALDDSTLEVLVYDEIGNDGWSDGISAKDVVQALATKPNAKTIRLRVNSPGGNVFDGLTIYNALKASPARIVVTVEGLAASAASFIAMAGDEVQMGRGSLLMIHEARSCVGYSTVEELRSAADLTEKLNATIVGMYTERVEAKGKTRADVVAAMAAETYFTAEEAIAWGLADSMAADVKAPADVAALAHLRPQGRDLFTRFAAMAESIPPKELTMSFKNIAKKLKIKADATEDEVVQAVDQSQQEIEDLKAQIAELQKKLDDLLAATGESAPAEAVAAARAGQSARTALTKMEARVVELERAAEAGERTQIVAQLRADKKVTPAMERDFVTTMSLDTLRAFAKVAPRVIAEAFTQPLPEIGSSALKTRDGKSWGELKPTDRANLKASDPDLYEAMRKNASA